MKQLAYWADVWMPLFITHMVELTVFIALIWLIDRMTDLPARLRCTLWTLALVKAWVPPLFSMPFEKLAETTQPAMAMTVKYAASYTAVAVGSTTIFPTAALALACLWLCSAALVGSFVLIHNLLLFRRLSHTASAPVDLGCLSAILPAGVAIYENESVASPVLVGLLRPRIYLPAGWRVWSDRQLRAVLSHEVAHYKHRDLSGLVLQTITVIFFGLNPCLWLVHRKLTRLREQRCDEAAIQATGIPPVDYAKLLYTCLEKQAARYQSLALGSPLFRGTRSLKYRIGHILNLPAAMPPISGRKYVPIALAVLMILPLSVRGADWNRGGPASFSASMEEDAGGVTINLRLYEDTKTVRLDLTLRGHEPEVIFLSGLRDLKLIMHTVRKKLAERDIPLSDEDLYKKVAEAHRQMIMIYKKEAGKRKMKAIDFDYSPFKNPADDEDGTPDDALKIPL